MSAKMYRIVLICEGVPKNAGEAAARDITNEFMHRPWHVNTACTWDGSQLVLQGDSDFDSDGLALRDEFSDAISACIEEAFDGELKVLSVTEIDAG